MLLVTDIETFNKALEFINANELLAYDVETTGLNPRKDKIIGFGISNGLDGVYLPLLRWDPTSNQLVPTFAMDKNLHEPIIKALQARHLLMFNASFDARFTKYNFGIDLLQALHTDVLLLKHTVDSEFPFGLKDIAANVFGHDVKAEKEAMKASIKANGGKPTEYYKADVEILAKYCVQDCLLTFKLHNYYLPLLAADELENFFYNDEVMPLYKYVTIPMEERGVALDMPKLRQALLDITVDIDATEAELQAALAPHLSAWTTAFLDREYPLVTPKGNLTKLGKEMAKYGFTDKFRMQAGAWRKDNLTNKYLFNLNSKHHLKALFFDILCCKPLSKTPAGAPQVDDDFIKSVTPKFTWCRSLTDYNRLQKIRSTYIERFINEAEDGIFYPSFHQHRTTSGRMGSDLQQLPRPIKSKDAAGKPINPAVVKYTNLIREFIIARPGFKLVSADFQQLEPSIFAHTSGDQALQNIFLSGKDFYSEIAIRTENLESFSSDKTAENYLGLLRPDIRQRAKAYALGIAYGLTGYKLQFELSVPQEVAEKLVRGYLNAFPQLESWMNESKRQAKEVGVVRQEFDRLRKVPEAVRIFNQYGPRVFDSLQLWKDYAQTPGLYADAKRARKTIINLCNSCINHQVQSLAASIVNRSGIRIVNALHEHCLLAAPVGQFHDEWLLEVPDPEVTTTSSLLKEIMQSTANLSVPLKTEPQAGANFRECK